MPEPAHPFIRYIADIQHYNEVLARAADVRSHLWLGTADIKDLYVRKSRDTVPFDSVWMGARCKSCGQKKFCTDRIV